MKEQTRKKISMETEDALRLISLAKEESLHTLASAAAEALKVKNAESGSDHDTLTSLVVSVKNIDTKFSEKFAEIRCDIKEIKDGTSERIKKLEEGKVSEVELQKIYDTRSPKWESFDARIEFLENWKNWVLGAFAVIGVVMALVIYIYINQITRNENGLQELKVLLQTHISQSK